MVEWSITPVLKTGVLRGTGGSNPSLSAKSSMRNIVGLFFYVYFITFLVFPFFVLTIYKPVLGFWILIPPIE